jgi:hypothetical protein
LVVTEIAQLRGHREKPWDSWPHSVEELCERFHADRPEQTIRAGRTAATLRQRVSLSFDVRSSYVLLRALKIEECLQGEPPSKTYRDPRGSKINACPSGENLTLGTQHRLLLWAESGQVINSFVVK